MSIANELQNLNQKLNTIDQSVQAEGTLIQRILTMANNLPDAGSGDPGETGGLRVASGKVESTANRCVEIPRPNFTPWFIALWNIQTIDQWEETGDDQLVRILYSGIMLSAVKVNGFWVAQFVDSSSGVTYIAQNTAAEEHRVPFNSGDQDTPYTNIIEDSQRDVILWSIGTPGAEDLPADASEQEFDYVIIGQ